MTEPAERLIRLKLKDGGAIDFSRTKKHDIIISHDDHSVNLGKASAQLTLDLIALLEPFGEIEEGE
ncbi:hypothetical protein LCGC14_3104670 [marine sediment metagenome]|uniref:Uncharacterized protein n=1 Tax=marine sediment metagenome TaxID=412755 RepID=A0A0F8W6U0_9ZZZZ